MLLGSIRWTYNFIIVGSYSTYACGMICDYLTADMKQELINIYGQVGCDGH